MIEKPIVYFTREITPEKVVEMYKKLGIELPGKVAVKVHSGEEGNQNYLRPEFMKPMCEFVNGTIVETNTAYPGSERDTTKKHLKVIEDHGWNKYFTVDLMDSEGPDIELPIKDSVHLKNNYVGKKIKNYDSMLVLSHFKGHPAAGFGGALKQLAIGCASASGKAWIHSAGVDNNPKTCWDHWPEQDHFLESMAEAASTIMEMFKGKIAFVSTMANMSVDCDCCSVAEDPCMKDIGILASLDPVAIDQACIDLVNASNDPGKEHFLERVNSRNGTHTIDYAEKLGVGSKEYELIEV